MDALTYRSIDLMKWTKDLLLQQPSDATIAKIVTLLDREFNLTHLAISVPMDTSAGYATPPTPRTATAFTQAWCTAIHNAGLKILHRPAWCGLEGIYDFELKVGEDRFPAGDASSTDATTWIGKTYLYIVNNPTFFESGDIFAPCPEMTNVTAERSVFEDGKSFLPDTGGITVQYANFFNNLRTACLAAFTAIGKTVTCGYVSQIYSEVSSGWVPDSVFTNAGVVPIDHYGTSHSPHEMDTDLRSIEENRGEPVFLQEWGDYWNNALSSSDRLYYYKRMCNVWKTLADEGKLVGFNYWGAWLTNMGYDTFEGILYEPNGLGFDNEASDYRLTGRGKLLASFLRGDGFKRIPVQDTNGNF